MIATSLMMPKVARGRGTLQILRYNRGMYGAAGVVLAGGAFLLWVMVVPRSIQLAILLGSVLTLFWAVSSLCVSHHVYDRVLPGRWKWLVALGPKSTLRWLQLHAGVDETGGEFHRLLPAAKGAVLDIFDPAEMTEPSILRARALQKGRSASSADYRALPLRAGSIDVVYLIFAAHELRRPAARDRLFCELSRILCAGGRVIMLEHCRGLANAVVFGPGVLHFFSRREWMRAAGQAGLRCVARTPVTSFADVLVWEKKP